MAAKQGKGLSHFFSKDKTFKPKKKFKEGTLRYDLHKQAKATLHSGISLQDCVKLPPGEDPNDWVAVHVVDFFNRINLIYGTVFEYCTPESCPSMTGGQRYEYFWCDGDKYKKPTALPAREYIALLMDWTENIINNEDVFPVDKDVPFPKVFLPSAKKILTRLFRVFVHVYIHHFTNIQDLQAEAHVNQCYKHFYYFISEFKLVDPRELEPLKTLTERLCPP